MKQKGLIDFTINFSAQNKIVITDIGKKLIDDADKKATETLDSLDLEVLKQLSVSKRNFIDISSALNIRSLDLTMHLYKLLKQDNISYTIQNANIELLLTESGFIKLKEPLLQQIKQNANDLINNKELEQKNDINNKESKQNQINNNKLNEDVNSAIILKQEIDRIKLKGKKSLIIVILIVSSILIIISFILKTKL